MPRAWAHGGDILRIMLSEPPRTMDPADQNATETRSILDPFYETLLRRDEAGAIRPGLATAWSAGPDGLTWRFTVRGGVRFHDGSPCDAAAIARSLTRLADPALGLSGGGTMRAVVARIAVEPDAAGMPRIVRIELRRPYADLAGLLTMTQTAIVSTLAIRAGTLGTRPDGTGPYRFVDWRDHARVLAARNDAYWGARPGFGGLDWRWSPEPSVLNMALATGDADVVAPLAPVFAALYPREGVASGTGDGRSGDLAGGDASEPATVSVAPGGTLFWVALDTRMAPLNDPRVRRALSDAIDRPALVAGLLHGFGRPACGALTPEIAGHATCDASAGLDLARARALLAHAGLAHGFRVAVSVQEPEAPIAEALQAMWRAIGVDLDIRRQEAGVWMQAAFAGPDAKRRDGLGMVLTSWAAPFLADQQLRPLYASGSEAPHGANLGFYDNPVIDAAIDAASREGNPPSRARDHATIERILAADAPILPLFVRDTVFGLARGIEGVVGTSEGEIVVAGAHR